MRYPLRNRCKLNKIILCVVLRHQHLDLIVKQAISTNQQTRTLPNIQIFWSVWFLRWVLSDVNSKFILLSANIVIQFDLLGLRFFSVNQTVRERIWFWHFNFLVAHEFFNCVWNRTAIRINFQNKFVSFILERRDLVDEEFSTKGRDL